MTIATLLYLPAPGNADEVGALYLCVGCYIRNIDGNTRNRLGHAKLCPNLCLSDPHPLSPCFRAFVARWQPLWMYVGQQQKINSAQQRYRADAVHSKQFKIRYNIIFQCAQPHDTSQRAVPNCIHRLSGEFRAGMAIALLRNRHCRMRVLVFSCVKAYSTGCMRLLCCLIYHRTCAVVWQ